MYLAPQGAKANQAGHQFTLVYLCNCRNCICIIIKIVFYDYHKFICIIRRACALRALGLLLADGAPTVGWGKTFWGVGRVLLTKTGVTRKRKIAQ